MAFEIITISKNEKMKTADENMNTAGSPCAVMKKVIAASAVILPDVMK